MLSDEQQSMQHDSATSSPFVVDLIGAGDSGTGDIGGDADDVDDGSSGVIGTQPR